MLKIAVCDDSKYIRSEVKKLILNYSVKKDLDYVLDEYDTGEKLVGTGEKYDLIFMDYEFEDKGANGLDISKQIRVNDKNSTIVFVSSYPSIVFESFEVGTFRFLTKPVDDNKFYDVMDAFVQTMQEDTILKIRLDGENHFFKESIIAYVEGMGKNCILHFCDGRDDMECHETLGAIEGRLSSNKFYRCYKSYLINLAQVKSYNHDEVTMSTGDKLLISRLKYKEFNNIYADFLVRVGG
ncbi:MAG: LytTR family DNA-binding domain-containing protein [Pseudobutyrivibrio sp.]|nr:LytTR family DNA-binding domain-containing protein [Pseudobutyrivibrio sp.]